jgi:3-methylfumaryl-CoA hydratase
MPSATATVDLEYLRRWIGREDRVEETVTPELVRRFHATFGLAGDPAQLGEPAPPLIHFCLGQSVVATDALGSDGHPAKGGFLPPVPLPRRMWAGGQIGFARDILVGDSVTRTSRIAEISLKHGRSGVLCFVTVEHRLSVAGSPALQERQDIVYRAAPTGHAEPVAPARLAESGIEHHAEIDISPTLLFRYSALTFNGHRIHYDRPYAMNVEGYSGLVVHGPLQATLLLQFATRIAGRAPDRFSFQGRHPLAAGPCRLEAADANGTLQLRTSSVDGPPAMTATAEWS